MRHRPTVFGLANPFHVSHYFIERDGSRYLAEPGSYLALESLESQIVRLDPRTFEPEIAYLIKSLIQPQDVVLDIGANVGVHTVAFARAAHQGHVYAFEPVEEMATRLSLNCALNGLDNVTIMPFALGDASGIRKMNVNIGGEGLEGTSSFMDSVHVRKQPWNYMTRQIPVKRLDDVAADIRGRIAFIKIDTEGFEPLILRYGMKTIKKDRPVMIVEAHSVRLREFGFNFQWYREWFPDYHILIIYTASAANPYLRLEPLGAEPPEIAANLLFLPRTPIWEHDSP